MPVERADLIIGGIIVLLVGIAAYPAISGGSEYTPTEKCSEVSMMLEQLWQDDTPVTADINDTVIQNLRNASGGTYQSVSCGCSPLSRQDRQSLDTPGAVQNVTEAGEQLTCTIEDDAFPGGQHEVTIALTQITGGNQSSNATVLE